MDTHIHVRVRARTHTRMHAQRPWQLYMFSVRPILRMLCVASHACSLTRARLYALLSNGEVHTWHVARGRPPTFASAWTHLIRDKCTAMTLIEGGSLTLPRKMRGAMGTHALPGSGVFTALHLTLADKSGTSSCSLHTCTHTHTQTIVHLWFNLCPYV